MGQADRTTRWLMVCCGTALQVCLGTVYAWSYFQDVLVRVYGWSHASVAWTFSIAICCLGLAAAAAGALLPRLGPRRLAVAGVVLFAAGHLVAGWGLARRSLPVLYLGYGALGGVGLGLGYVTPVATVARWFPARKGLATGLVIMGFGLGALAMSKLVAPLLMSPSVSGGDPAVVFGALGLGLFVVALPVALVLRNPPMAAAGEAAALPKGGEPPFSLPTFAVVWALFFANIVAGISIIGFQSPLVQDLWRLSEGGLSAEQLAARGASLIAVTSLFNGFGRMLWGGLSDRIGRITAFRVMLGSQVLAFVALARVSSPAMFSVLACYILLCYGGGFGTMPTLVLNQFGERRMAVAYGGVLTAWSAAGVAGPQLVASLKDHGGDDAASWAFLMGAAVLAVGFVLALGLRERAVRPAG